MTTQQSYTLPTDEEVRFCGDELWVRSNGSRVTIMSMSESHAKNALRKIIRMVRTQGQMPEWMQQAMEQARAEEDAPAAPKD
jgi:hypothetical protein